jgi:FkbM family methyltransferase
MVKEKRTVGNIFRNIPIRIARVIGFKIKWSSQFLLKAHNPHSRRGLGRLDSEIIRRLTSPSGYYVELGANDGVAQSNTLILELFYNWTGLLIEPVPNNFARLIRNRSARRNRFIQTACVSNEYALDEVVMAPANLMSTPLGLDNDIVNPIAHARSALQFLGGGEKVLDLIHVPAMTLTQALILADAPSLISLLSLDVEGAEMEVLRGVDFSRYRFESIIIESRNILRIKQFLSPHGYVFSEKLTPLDYLFVYDAHTT